MICVCWNTKISLTSNVLWVNKKQNFALCFLEYIEILGVAYVGTLKPQIVVDLPPPISISQTSYAKNGVAKARVPQQRMTT